MIDSRCSLYGNTGTTISTFVLRAGQSAANYRQRATEIKDLKSEKKTITKKREDATDRFKVISKRYREQEAESTAAAKKMKFEHEAERTSLMQRVQDAQSALCQRVHDEECAKQALKTPLGLAKALELSPGTQKKMSISTYSSGFLRGHGIKHALENPRKRFVGRIKRCLTPLVKTICSFPKFEDGNTDIAGVAQLILKKIMKSCKTQRTLFAEEGAKTEEDSKRSDRISDELDAFLKEMGSRWRDEMFAHDRDAARQIEEITLKAIGTRQGKKLGRVTDWLGPKYFDSIVPITLYSEVRILNPTDTRTKFRNACAGTRSSLVTGSVTLVGEEHCEVMVLEDFGPQVVIQDDSGEERVLNLDDLKRCEDNPHPMNHPANSVLHHRWNRKQFVDCQDKKKVGRRLCQGMRVHHKVTGGKTWKTSIVLRVVRGYNKRHVTYTIAKDRVLHANSVRLSQSMIKRARKTTKLWGGRKRPHGSVRERHVISPATYDHLREYVFSNDFVEPLKASEQAIRRGHCFAIREAISSSYPRYRQDATKHEIKPVSLKVFKRIFASKVFTKYRKDHCMCKTCLRSGWRGIWERGRKLLKSLNDHKCWPRTETVDGEQEVHRPQLDSRLKRSVITHCNRQTPFD